MVRLIALTLEYCQLTGKGRKIIGLILLDSIHDDEDRDSANRILMGNFLEHMKQLHNKELLFTSAESQRFTRMLFSRPRENNSPLPFFMQGGIQYLDSSIIIMPINILNSFIFFVQENITFYKFLILYRKILF